MTVLDELKLKAEGKGKSKKKEQTHPLVELFVQRQKQRWLGLCALTEILKTPRVKAPEREELNPFAM